MSTIEELFSAFSDDVNSFLVYFTRSIDVDDLIQETFIRAMKAFDKFEGRSSEKTWLLQIARNVAIDHFRRRSRREVAVNHQYFLELMSVDKSPEEIVEIRDTAAGLLDALDQMKRNYREVIICRAIFDMSTEETAKILGWSSNKVRVTLHRALRMARRVCHESE